MNNGSSDVVLCPLREKYVALLALREAQERGEGDDPRPAMRALAARFPGALRELDTLPTEALTLRLRAVDDALAHGRPAAWMRALARYHAWMRLALALRRATMIERSEAAAQVWLAGWSPLHPDDVAPQDVDAALLAALLRPAGGRLHAAVRAQVSRELGVAPGELDALLGGQRAAP